MEAAHTVGAVAGLGMPLGTALLPARPGGGPAPSTTRWWAGCRVARREERPRGRTIAQNRMTQWHRAVTPSMRLLVSGGQGSAHDRLERARRRHGQQMPGMRNHEQPGPGMAAAVRRASGTPWSAPWPPTAPPSP
jgi:hypothetical protein